MSTAYQEAIDRRISEHEDRICQGEELLREGAEKARAVEADIKVTQGVVDDLRARLRDDHENPILLRGEAALDPGSKPVPYHHFPDPGE